ncbi:MAG: Spy/CpxP family protein refolding chaperone [Thermoanaerobaculia bacterium]
MKRGFVLVAIICFAVIADAQQPQLPRGRWWRQEGVVKRLQLTDAQQKKLDDIAEKSGDVLRDARDEVEKLQLELRQALDRPQSRAADVQRLAAQLGAARSRFFEREVALLLEIRGVLNAQQWSTLRQRMVDRPQPDGPRPPRQPRQPGQPRPPRRQ